VKSAVEGVDGDESVDVGDEPGRIDSGGLGGRIVVEVDQPRRVLIGSDLGDEHALADLAGSKPARARLSANVSTTSRRR
jgi:hypothetical protein